MAWPRTVDELVQVQRELAAAVPPSWRGPSATIGGCAIRSAKAGDAAWAAAVADKAESVVAGRVHAPYAAGLLALREGPLLEAAVRGATPDVLLVDATGRDHPRRAGLALHLGAVLDLPTVGVTHRPLLAQGDWPEDGRGASAAAHDRRRDRRRVAADARRHAATRRPRGVAHRRRRGGRDRD